MKRSRGFTLIELMIVIGIVAILAAIAIPSYTDYVRRGRITEAISTLAGMRVKMEQFFQDNRSYALACVAGTVAPQPANTAYWTYNCAGLTLNTYLITATGAVGRADQCRGQAAPLPGPRDCARPGDSAGGCADRDGADCQ